MQTHARTQRTGFTQHHFFVQQKSGAGFTLVEILVYVAVTVLVMLASVTTLLSLDDVLIRNQTERALTNAANVTLERVLRDVRGATNVNLGLSSFGSSPGTLVVETEAAATTTEFYVTGGAVHASVNGNDIGPLTPSSVSVESLIFYHYIGTSTEMIRTELTLRAESKVASTTKTYRASGVLRGSYE
jgi:type II secretory pathway pseudopilin PulG